MSFLNAKPSAYMSESHPGLGTLFRDYAQLVARWASRLGGPSLEVEDLVQEVFLIAHRRLESFRGGAKMSTWLYGITLNVVRYRRRKERLRYLGLGAAADSAALAAVWRPTAVEELERRAALSLVYRLLDGMREKYRTVFILYEIDGMSGPEIGELTGLNLATLRVRLHRARAQFFERLDALDRKGMQ